MKYLLIFMLTCLSFTFAEENKQENRFIDIHLSGVSYGSTSRSTVDMENQGRQDAKKLCENHYGYSFSEDIDIDCEDGYRASCKIKYSSKCTVRGFYSRKVEDFKLNLYEEDYELFSALIQEVEESFNYRNKKSPLTQTVGILINEVDDYSIPRVSIDCPHGYSSIRESKNLNFCSHNQGINCQVRSSGICADRSYIKL